MSVESVYVKPSRHSNIPSLIVKSSFKAFIAYLVIAFVTLFFACILLYFSLGFLFSSLPSINPLRITLLLFVLGSLVIVGVGIYTLLWRLNQQYEIKYDSIVENFGILQRKLTITAIRDIENLKLNRNILGRWLDFGTIEIKKVNAFGFYMIRDIPNSKFVFDRLYKNWRSMLSDKEID